MTINRTGNCRWMGKPDSEDLREGTALLRITTSKGVESHYWVYHGAHETRLRKMGDGTVYAVNLRTGWCECPDHQQRKCECKHVRALRSALPKIGS